MLAKARAGGYAIPAFNVFGYEDISPLIRAAREASSPLILMTNGEACAYMPIECFAALVRELEGQADAPICLHLDHARELEPVSRAIRAGYDSVMFDGSRLPYAENLAMTRKAAELARAGGASIEAEIGAVGYSDSGAGDEELTDPEEARAFAEASGLDALAVAVGTVHRMTERTARIRFDILERIAAIVPVPLVIHGSSGVLEEDLMRLPSFGVAKINFGTTLRMSFGKTLRKEFAEKPEEFDRMKLFKAPMEAVRVEALRLFRLLGCGGKA
jgi:fructose-bisphosphate aldolase class II